MSQQTLFQDFCVEEEPSVIEYKKTMTKTRCFCGETRNTFAIDYCKCSDGWIFIRLCKECCKKEGFKPDLTDTKKCVSCGERFESKLDWQKTCPICFIKSKGDVKCKK